MVYQGRAIPGPARDGMGTTVSFRLEGRASADEPGFPWRLALEGGVPAGRWLKVRYATNLFAAPVRPVIRFPRAGGVEDALLPGPALGRAFWLGRVPADARDILFDPGVQAFAIESVEVLSDAGLLARLLLRRPDRAAVALSFLARRQPRRFRDTLRGALATTPLANWAAYAAERRRPVSPDLDRPLAEGAALSVLLVIEVPRGGGADGAATLASLAGGSHALWRAVLVGDGAGEVEAADERVARAAWPGRLAPLLGASAPDLVGVLAAGDVLAPEALALMADRFAAAPGARLVYADEEVAGAAGAAPRLKPAWSPDLALVSGYVGRPALHAHPERLGAIEAASPAILEEALVREAALAAPGARVERVPRPLLRRAASLPVSPEAARARLAQGLARAGVPASARLEAGRIALDWPLPEPPPLVSVVMPTRDRLDLVRRSVEGVLRETDYPALELLVVDNGSRDPGVLRFYEGLAGDARVRLLAWPHAFDFAAMVNDGAARARGEVLLLLNNDTAVLHPDWLAQMVRQALRPEVGAVGAKLLYEDGRLQHAGVVVGLGGRAGHLLRRRPADTPGRLGQIDHAHEVSAVTAACLAVARAKYAAVGGLDGDAFPIDFNDVDLCLRLAARGWKTVYTPRARLLHLESVSRGPPQGAARARFEAEAARFTARWGATIRDDPFYHPLLSATTFGEALE